MRLIWYTVLIRAIPETLGLVLLSLTIIKEKRLFKDILLTSIICGLIGFTMKMLPLKFGIHTVLIVIIEAIIMNIMLKIKLQKTFLGLLVSLAILTATEIVTISFIEYVLKMDPQVVHSTAIGILLAGLPSVLMLYLAAFTVYKFNNRVSRKETTSYVNQ